MILTFREEWFDDRLKFDDQNGKFNRSLTVRFLNTDDKQKLFIVTSILRHGDEQYST